MKKLSRYTRFSGLLKDELAEKKKRNPEFSLGFLANEIQMTEKVLVSEVLTGKRPLSVREAERTGEILGLHGREMQYFMKLRGQETGKVAKTSGRAGRNPAGSRPGKTFRPVRLKKDQRAYFSKWYHAAIREIATVVRLKGNHKKLGQLLTPRVSPQEVKQSIELLVRLGLLSELPEGGYAQTGPMLLAGSIHTKDAVHGFQRDMIGLASESLRRHTKDERNISGLTVGLSRKMAKTFSKEIDAFRKRLREMALSDSAAQRVYQVNLHLFPLSKDFAS